MPTTPSSVPERRGPGMPFARMDFQPYPILTAPWRPINLNLTVVHAHKTFVVAAG